MLIIINNYAATEAYAVHIIDIYDHYRWTNHIKNGQRAWNSLYETYKQQDKYFDANAKGKNSVQFWLSDSVIKLTTQIKYFFWEGSIMIKIFLFRKYTLCNKINSHSTYYHHELIDMKTIIKNGIDALIKYIIPKKQNKTL